MHSQYQIFLNQLDKRLEIYYETHKEFLHCKEGCSSCCEKGDYPISQIELEYLMQGFIALNPETKRQVQESLKNIQKGGACPFLIDKKCSIYPFRPIICRTHGLAYLCKDNIVKLPYCVNENKNYSTVYENGEFTINPVQENLDTPNLLKDFDFGEIRNLVDWLELR